MESIDAALRGGERRTAAKPELTTLSGRTWMTRRGVKVDRIATAWRIRRLVDAGARFQFVRDKAFYSLPDFIETREYSKAFDGFAAFTNWGANLTGTGEPERFTGARISAYGFQMMGVRAVYGRTLEAADDRPSSECVAVLSYGLWQRRFGGDPGLVGRKLTLNGDS